MVKEILKEEMEKTEIPETMRQRLWKAILTFIHQKMSSRKNME